MAKDREMVVKNSILFYLKLLYKKIKDLKLKAKIRFSLFMIAVLTVISIGVYSYHIASREIINNSSDAVLGMIRQGSINLEDRISSFQDVSYRIVQASNIEKLLDYTEDEARQYRVINEGLPAAISQHSSFARYAKYALLRPNSGQIYDYYKYGQNKLSMQEQKDLLDVLDEKVNKNHPTCWTVYDNEVFFVRQVVTPNLKENGIMCFALEDSFFNFVSDDIEYLNNDNVVVLNADNLMLKGSDKTIDSVILEDVERIRKENYYTYTFTKEINNDTYSVTIVNAQVSGWTVVAYYSYSILLRGIRRIYIAMLEVVAIVVIIILIVTAMISRTITKNISLIEYGMHQYESGHFDYRIKPSNYDEIGLLGLQLNYMAIKINELIGMLHREEEEKKQKEIETLQAQINPHFLYNTLGSLKWSAFRQGQKELAGSLDALINLLRFTIKKAGGMVNVEEEISYIKNYITIEKMRYGDQFLITYEISESVKDIQIPGFILQPLVENCFLHGFDMVKEKGMIIIRSYRIPGFLVMEVEDNGEGIEKEKLEKLLEPDPEKEKKYKGFSSIGLKIVDKRLKELYGKQYRTIITSVVGEGTKIALQIPVEEYANEMESADRR